MTPQIADVIQRLLSQLPESDQLDFFKLNEALYNVRFTGPVTYDYRNGVPHQINLGQPIRLSICEGLPPGGLDKTVPPDRR